MSTKSQVHAFETPWRAVAIAAAVCALILGSIVMIAMTLSELGNAPAKNSMGAVTFLSSAQSGSEQTVHIERFSPKG